MSVDVGGGCLRVGDVRTPSSQAEHLPQRRAVLVGDMACVTAHSLGLPSGRTGVLCHQAPTAAAAAAAAFLTSQCRLHAVYTVQAACVTTRGGFFLTHVLPPGLTILYCDHLTSAEVKETQMFNSSKINSECYI